MRIATGVLVGVLAAGLTGCLSDLLPYRQNANQGDDAGTNGNTGGDQPDLGSDPGADLLPASNGDGGVGATPDLADCIPKSTQAIDGHHHPGENCLTCHDGNTAGANKFYVAGTLFDALTGGNGVAQATIELTDNAGNKMNLVTAIGNFWTEQPVTFPINVRASSCPNTMKMNDPVTEGGCNSCHNAQMQIHLP